MVAYTNAAWRVFDDKTWLYALRRGREILDQYWQHTRRRQHYQWKGDVTAITEPHAGNTIDGVDYGVNTTANGRLWVRIVDLGGGDVSVRWYTAAGASGLVASGTGQASTTVALTAQNGSGLSGGWRLPASPVFIGTDIAQIVVKVDDAEELDKLFDAGTVDDEASRSACKRLSDSLASLKRQELAAILRYMQEVLLTAPDNVVAEGKRFLADDTALTLFAEDENRDPNNNVTRTLSGIIKRLSDEMANEVTEDEQDILIRVVARSAGSFAAANVGQGACASGAAEQRCPLGTWRFVCTAGKGSGAGGSEIFDGTFVGADEDLTFSISGLQVNRSYVLPNGGGTIAITRTYSKLGTDGTNVQVGAASTFTFTGENEINTELGVLYGSVASNGANWDISFYSDSGRSVLVAKATNVATGAVGASAVAQGGSGLSLTFTVGSAPTNGGTFSISAQYFAVGTATTNADEFSFTTTLTSEGTISRLLALIATFPGTGGLGWQLNGDTSGSELLSDDLVRRGTFFPYTAEDV